jgi:hypothetical protein
VLADYGFYADSGMHEEFVDNFTDDGLLEINGGEPSGTYGAHESWRGRESLLLFINDPAVHLSIEGRCMHVPTLNPRILLTGDTAIAETYSLVLVLSEGQVVINGAGFTRWEFERMQGRWRIARRSRHAIGEATRRLQDEHALP